MSLGKGISFTKISLKTQEIRIKCKSHGIMNDNFQVWISKIIGPDYKLSSLQQNIITPCPLRTNHTIKLLLYLDSFFTVLQDNSIIILNPNNLKLPCNTASAMVRLTLLSNL